MAADGIDADHRTQAGIYDQEVVAGLYRDVQRCYQGGTAAGVGIGHAVLPDHWLPLAVVGRTRRYPLAKLARVSLLAAIAHVLISVVLGGVIIAVGLQFRSTVQSAQDTIIGGHIKLGSLGSTPPAGVTPRATS